MSFGVEEGQKRNVLLYWTVHTLTDVHGYGSPLV